jgi:hypothetical protein
MHKLKTDRFIVSLMSMTIAAVPALGADTFDGAYAGERFRTKGPDSTCYPVEEDVSVVVSSGKLSFSNSRLQNYGMGFYPRPDGSFNQVHVDVGGSFVDIRGHVIGDVLDADVTDGTCEYHWHLTKPKGQ